MSKEKQYLGDGAYVDIDEGIGGIVLTAENGLAPTDTIYLEAEALKSLERFIAAARKSGALK